jgi:hypothetical protein
MPCRHILNAQVSMTFPNGKWYSCHECFHELVGRPAPIEDIGPVVSLACLACKQAFQKDLRLFDDLDEVCPHCKNRFALPARTPEGCVYHEATAVLDAAMDELSARRHTIPKDAELPVVEVVLPTPIWALARLRLRALAAEGQGLAQRPDTAGTAASSRLGSARPAAGAAAPQLVASKSEGQLPAGGGGTGAARALRRTGSAFRTPAEAYAALKRS